MAVSDYIQRIFQMHDNLKGRDVKIDELSSTFAYIGFAKSGSLTSAAVWKIMRVFRQGTLHTIEEASGGEFTQIWDDRVSLFSSGVLGNSYSVNFDGVNDYVDFGNNYNFETSQAFSISFWVKPQNISATRCMISKCSSDANVFGYNICQTATSGAVLVQFRTALALSSHTFTTTLTAGVWQHITATFSGNQNMNGWRIYKNAVVGDTPGSSSNIGTLVNTASFIVGARNTALFFAGNIDEVSVWNKSLSAAEVSEIYNTGQPADLAAHSAFANLQSWWRMGDSDTYPTILDHVGSINGTMTNMLSGDIESDVP